MPKVTFLRHAQSLFNEKGDRSRNVRLSANGEKQASLITGEYDVVICSPLARAIQTLLASKIKYAHLSFSDHFREVRDGNPINLFPLESTDRLYESQEELSRRLDVARSVLSVLSRETVVENGVRREYRVLVVSHSTFLHSLTGKWFANGELTVEDVA